MTAFAWPTLRVLLGAVSASAASTAAVICPSGFLWLPGVAFGLLFLLPLSHRRASWSRRVFAVMLSSFGYAVAAILPIVGDFLFEATVTQSMPQWLVCCAVSGCVGGLALAVSVAADSVRLRIISLGKMMIGGAMGGLLFAVCLGFLPDYLPWLWSVFCAFFFWQVIVGHQLAVLAEPSNADLERS